jgi:hypothetical protein
MKMTLLTLMEEEDACLCQTSGIDAKHPGCILDAFEVLKSMSLVHARDLGARLYNSNICGASSG